MGATSKKYWENVNWDRTTGRHRKISGTILVIWNTRIAVIFETVESDQRDSEEWRQIKTKCYFKIFSDEEIEKNNCINHGKTMSLI